MKMHRLIFLLGLAISALSAHAQSVKGLEIDPALKVQLPADVSCVRVLHQPLDGTTQYAEERNLFVLSLGTGSPVVAPAPGIVVRDSTQPLVIFHGTDVHGNNVLSVFSRVFDQVQVKKGQYVQRGQTLGTTQAARKSYFSALVSQHADPQALLDSAFQIWRANSVSAAYFLYPIRQSSGKIEVNQFAKNESAESVKEADWMQNKKFTGFTFPFVCKS